MGETARIGSSRQTRTERGFPKGQWEKSPTGLHSLMGERQKYALWEVELERLKTRKGRSRSPQCAIVLVIFKKGGALRRSPLTRGKKGTKRNNAEWAGGGGKEDCFYPERRNSFLEF